MEPVEEIILRAVQWLRLIIETIGAVIVGIGVIATLVEIGLSLAYRGILSFERVRLTLGRFLVLGLEFQLAADILSTAIAPSWEQIGKLGAIAVIRTGLNYFLMVEMRSERQNLGKAIAEGKVT